MVTLIKSIEKTLLITEFLGRNPNSSLKDICAYTALNKSTAYRLLATLEHKNYVFQSPETQRYCLTVKFAHLGYQSFNHGFIQKLRPILTSLMEEMGETVNLMMRENDYMVFHDKLEPHNAPFRTRAHIGMYSEIYCTAGGKSILAFSPLEEQEQYWIRNQHCMKQYTDTTITTKDAFFEELALIQTQGYAHDNEENESGISCVAVSKTDSSSLPAFSVSISTLTPRLHNLGIEHVAERIHKVLAQI